VSPDLHRELCGARGHDPHGYFAVLSGCPPNQLEDRAFKQRVVILRGFLKQRAKVLVSQKECDGGGHDPLDTRYNARSRLVFCRDNQPQRFGFGIEIGTDLPESVTLSRYPNVKVVHDFLDRHRAACSA
jgi:hypothetical protein